jgi:hypothetical protein
MMTSQKASFVIMLFLSASSFAQFFDTKELRPGMKATGYTVFSSSKGIEPFEIEILGQMKNAVGPGQNLLIARVLGERFTKSSVAAGMSGSPVYIDGKLVGALSYAFGHFTNEAIAGITPIQNMLGDIHLRHLSSVALAKGEGFGGRAQDDRAMRPIALSLVAQGLSPRVAKYFDKELQGKGLATPVLAAGGFGPGFAEASTGRQELKPGSPFAMILIGGDMNLSAIGTVTWVSGSQMIGLGHPFLQNGVSELPLAGAEIVTTIFGQDEPYKMGQPTQIMGVLTGDRSSGVTGVLGSKPRVMPLEVQIGDKTFHYDISRTGKDTLFLTSIALSNSLAMTPEHELGGSYLLNTEVKMTGGEKISYERMVAVSGLPLEPLAIASFLEPVMLLQNQDFKKSEFESMKIRVEHTGEIKTARLLGFTIFSDPQPGKSLELMVYTQPWRKKLEKQHVVLNMPYWNIAGDYQIIGLDRAASLALEKESGYWSEIPNYAVLLSKIQTMPKDTEVCFYLKESDQSSNFLGYNLTDLPISLKESLTNVRAGSEMAFNTKATRLGCVDLRAVVTGKVLKDYGEKKQP